MMAGYIFQSTIVPTLDLMDKTEYEVSTESKTSNEPATPTAPSPCVVKLHSNGGSHLMKGNFSQANTNLYINLHSDSGVNNMERQNCINQSISPMKTVTVPASLPPLPPFSKERLLSLYESSVLAKVGANKIADNNSRKHDSTITSIDSLALLGSERESVACDKGSRHDRVKNYNRHENRRKLVALRSRATQNSSTTRNLVGNDRDDGGICGVIIDGSECKQLGVSDDESGATRQPEDHQDAIQASQKSRTIVVGQPRCGDGHHTKPFLGLTMFNLAPFSDVRFKEFDRKKEKPSNLTEEVEIEYENLQSNADDTSYICYDGTIGTHPREGGSAYPTSTTKRIVLTSDGTSASGKKSVTLSMISASMYESMPLLTTCENNDFHGSNKCGKHLSFISEVSTAGHRLLKLLTKGTSSNDPLLVCGGSVVTTQSGKCPDFSVLECSPPATPQLLHEVVHPKLEEPVAPYHLFEESKSLETLSLTDMANDEPIFSMVHAKRSKDDGVAECGKAPVKYVYLDDNGSDGLISPYYQKDYRTVSLVKTKLNKTSVPSERCEETKIVDTSPKQDEFDLGLSLLGQGDTTRLENETQSHHAVSPKFLFRKVVPVRTSSTSRSGTEDSGYNFLQETDLEERTETASLSVPLDSDLASCRHVGNFVDDDDEWTDMSGSDLSVHTHGNSLDDILDPNKYDSLCVDSTSFPDHSGSVLAVERNRRPKNGCRPYVAPPTSSRRLNSKQMTVRLRRVGDRRISQLVFKCENIEAANEVAGGSPPVRCAGPEHIQNDKKLRQSQPLISRVMSFQYIPPIPNLLPTRQPTSTPANRSSTSIVSSFDGVRPPFTYQQLSDPLDSGDVAEPSITDAEGASIPIPTKTRKHVNRRLPGRGGAFSVAPVSYKMLICGWEESEEQPRISRKPRVWIKGQTIQKKNILRRLAKEKFKVSKPVRHPVLRNSPKSIPPDKLDFIELSDANDEIMEGLLKYKKPMSRSFWKYHHAYQQ